MYRGGPLFQSGPDILPFAARKPFLAFLRSLAPCVSGTQHDLTQREPMAKRTKTSTVTTTATRTQDAEQGATLALMALASAATHAQQCKLHEVQVLLALHAENRTVQQHAAATVPVPVRNFWSAASTSSRAPGGPVRPCASPPPLSLSLSASSAGPSTKRRAESTPSGASSTTGKKACRWKGTVLLNAPAAPLSPTAAPARAPAPAAAAPSKKAVRCNWHTTQQIVPGKSARAPASPLSVLSPPASPRGVCEWV